MALFLILTELFFYNNTSVKFYHALNINIGSEGEGKVVVSVLLSIFYYHEEAHTICCSDYASGSMV